MPNHLSSEQLLFTDYIKLKTEHCLYSKSPETILSLFSDPENFAMDHQKVRELNDKCTGCEWYQKK